MRLRGLLVVAAVLVFVAPWAHAEQSVEALVESIGNTDYKLRNPAYTELIRRKDPKAVSLLVAKLPGWSTSSQSMGVQIIEYTPGKASVSALKKLLQPEHAYLCARSAASLNRLKATGFDGIFQKLFDAVATDTTKLRSAIDGLYNVDRPALRKIMREQFKQNGEAESLLLSRFLNWFRSVGGDDTVVDWARAKSASEEPRVRVLAGAWMLYVDDPAGLEPFISALETGEVDYSTFSTFQSWFYVKGSLDPKAQAAIADRLSEETNSSFITVGLRLLAKLGYANLKGLAESLLEDSNESIATAAFEALAGMSGGLNADVLRKLLAESPDDGRRLLAAEALRKMDDDSGLEVVLGIAKDNAAKRSEAARVLGGFRIRRVVDPLIEMLSDPDQTVRQKASYSLGYVWTSLFQYRRLQLQAAGYAYTKSPAENSAAVAKIRAWWQAHKDGTW
ncbi:MAG: HEAT repeat domain-containing protein [bacterium]|nr:HEAT repeat domain-containing protein [bacterium]